MVWGLRQACRAERSKLCGLKRLTFCRVRALERALGDAFNACILSKDLILLKWKPVGSQLSRHQGCEASCVGAHIRNCKDAPPKASTEPRGSKKSTKYRSYLHTFGTKVGIIYILGALDELKEAAPSAQGPSEVRGSSLRIAVNCQCGSHFWGKTRPGGLPGSTEAGAAGSCQSLLADSYEAPFWS